MEEGLGPSPGSIDKSRVLDVMPLRYLVPVFPGMSSGSAPQPTPFMCVPPSGPFPCGVQPFYPFLVPNDSQNPISAAQNQPSTFAFNSNIPAPVPLNSYKSPSPHANGGRGRAKKGSKVRRSVPMTTEDDGYSESHNQSDAYVSELGIDADGADDAGSSGKRRGRRRRSRVENFEDFDVGELANDILTVYKLKELDDFRRTNGDKDTVRTVLLVFELIRRRLTQLEESKTAAHAVAKRPDLKTTSLLMSKGVRTNSSKRIGHVPGVEIGDIFFFRMELCIVGLHAPSMAGIDYMTIRTSVVEEPMAVSIVSSGAYDDDGNDSDVIIYSGHGGVQRKDKKMIDQKLERGNLALEKSVLRANDVRVIRGLKDSATTGGKIYVYDGLYKIQDSWIEKNKSGCSVFKYKLVRLPGQQEVYSLWKRIQQWKDGTAVPAGLILPDLTSGTESQPVALGNDVDREKGPAHFTYIRSLKYSEPFSTSKPLLGCHCMSGCRPDDSNCPCNHKNEGFLPYSSLGILLTDRSLIYECGPTCACPPTCRNRISQAGIRVHMEVFRTKDRGWGLRSWYPIRAGGFVCEYAGDIVKDFTFGDFRNEDDEYIFDATRYYPTLEPGHDSSGSRKSPFPLVISAKDNGNVGRFMNHSCSPNVFWQPVLRESNNDSYLHIAFFAIRHIPPMQELTFDYGFPEKGDQGRKKCLCGSDKCRGYFY